MELIIPVAGVAILISTIGVPASCGVVALVWFNRGEQK